MKTMTKFWAEFKCSVGFHDWTVVWSHGFTGKYRCKRSGCQAVRFEINSL